MAYMTRLAVLVMPSLADTSCCKSVIDLNKILIYLISIKKTELARKALYSRKDRWFGFNLLCQSTQST